MQSQSLGVQITQSTGQAGDGFKVNIRGIGTTGNSAPLYVIEGITGGDINSLNPSDIESIDVLKDAASADIYGARAANGVILVTTKQGKAGNKLHAWTSLGYIPLYIRWLGCYKREIHAEDFLVARLLEDSRLVGSERKPKHFKLPVSDFLRLR